MKGNESKNEQPMEQTHKDNFGMSTQITAKYLNFNPKFTF